MTNILKLKPKEINNLFYIDGQMDITDFSKINFTFDKINPTKVEMKKPYTVEEMIAKLVENHMTFEEKDLEDCEEFLKIVNYYTFKHYANIEFGKNSFKQYKAVKEIYLFNQYLRGWLHDILSHIEVFLRTSIVDILSQKYSSNEYQSAQFYIDESIYFEESGKRSKSKKDRVMGVNKMLESFGNVITDNMKRHEAFKHNQDLYGAVPAWILFDLLTLGQMSTFFNYLIPRYKKIVARELVVNKNCIITGELLASWINSLRFLRNVVSHTGKIYGSNFDILPKKHDKDDEFIKKLEVLNYDKRLIVYLLIIKRIIIQMPDSIKLYWNDKLDELFKEINHNKNVKPSRMGFIENTLEYLYI